MTFRRDWIRFDQHEKTEIHFWRTCCTALKKLKTFYHVFKTLPLFSRLFPGLENCWANFESFSRIQDSVRTLPFLTWIRSFTIFNFSKTSTTFNRIERRYVNAINFEITQIHLLSDYFTSVWWWLLKLPHHITTKICNRRILSCSKNFDTSVNWILVFTT